MANWVNQLKWWHGVIGLMISCNLLAHAQTDPVVAAKNAGIGSATGPQLSAPNHVVLAQARVPGPTESGPSPRVNSSTTPQPLAAQGSPVEVKTSSPAPAAVALQPNSTALTNGYRISPNDLLEVDVYGVAELRRTARVTASGQVALPLIGSVSVGGLTAEAAELLIAKRYGEKHLQEPQVSVYVKEYTTEKITIEGAVARPGIYPVTGQITLLKAMALAGGGASMADLSAVTLMRPDGAGGVKNMTYDLDRIRNGKEEDPTLKGDDMIVVQRDPTRKLLRDSLFRDILDSVNPFSVFARP